MGRRRRTILDELMVLPWWYSAIASLIAFIFLGFLLPAALPQDGIVFAAFTAALPMLAPVVALVLLVPMPFAYLNGRRKMRLVDANTGVESILALSWREFEQLVAEAYRRKGYTVRENLTGGPDGGVDVSLEKAGRLHLVQCKQWKTRKVGVSVVREMYGVMIDRGASSVIIISAGTFTQEAKKFAESKPIDLMGGAQLSALIADVQVGIVETVAPAQVHSPTDRLSCPDCGGELVIRTARRGQSVGKQFMGCSGFPKCRYTQDV